ncbi:MAG: hypothetical protein A2901_02275 [Elusimicrobia bacterium RIFCSPLOWO2_01_FULL_54_10]|nr:MAG: hypothetical protein A2901_02275 [Elusimicrobia bacterium RIFCSPLOWO2_01_FULL_54_10]
MRDSWVRETALPYLKKHLTRERLGHTMAVSLLSERLARKHGLNHNKARLAGLLHDVAKCKSGKALVRYALKYKLRPPNFEETCRQRPKMLHAYVGAHLARRVLKVRDKQILSAIAKHTLGSDKMSGLDKCVFMADLASYDRKYDGAKTLRQYAMKNLDKAFVEGLRLKLKNTLRDREWLHPESVRVWNFWGPKE